MANSAVSAALMARGSGAKETKPFIWGSDGSRITPADAARMRKTSDALRQRADYVPPGPWSLIGSLAGEGAAAFQDHGIDEAEGKAKAHAAELAGGLADGADMAELTNVLNDEYTTPRTSAVAQALMGRNFAAEDRGIEWGHQDQLRQQDRAWETEDRGTEWGRQDQLRQQDRGYQIEDRADDRAYDAPLRDLQLQSGQEQLSDLKAGYQPLTTPEDRAKYGIGADDPGMYQLNAGTNQVEPVGGKGGQTINIGGEGADAALNNALSTKEGEAWAGYKAAGTVSAANAQDFGVLDELIKIAPQGPIIGQLAETFKGFSSAGDAFQSIVKRIAPTLRAPGSGATSDIEYDGMLQSLPALKNAPEGNTMILSIMKAKAQINVQRSEVISSYQAGELSVAEARAKLNELDRVSIVAPEMRQALLGVGASGDVGTAAPKAGEVVDGYEYLGGDPASPTSWKQR